MLLSMIFLFILLNFYYLNYQSLFILVCNIVSFCFMVYFFRTNSTTIKRYRILFCVFNVSYAIAVFFLLFVSFSLKTKYPFLSPKNISVVFCILENCVFLVLNLNCWKTLRSFHFKNITLGQKQIRLDDSLIFLTKQKKFKISYGNIALSLISIFLFAISGCFSKNGQFDFLTQKITYAEKASSAATYLAFQKYSKPKTGELSNLSKDFTDFSYYGHKKYAPVVVDQAESVSFKIRSSIDSENNIDCSILSFYSFDCYLHKGEWVSSYSGLKYIGEMRRPTMLGYHLTFISFSLAEKIVDNGGYSSVSDIVGKTFEINLNNSIMPFFVCNVILDNTEEYNKYYTNYGDFIVIPQVDNLINDVKTRIDFYFTESSSYNKELLRFLTTKIDSSDEWIASSNYQDSQYLCLSSFWNLRSDFSYDTLLSILFFVLAIIVFVIKILLDLIYTKKKNSCFLDSIVVLLVFASIQTLLFCFWQFFGFCFFPASSVCLMMSGYVFLTIFSIFFRREVVACKDYLNQKSFYIILI